MISKSTFLLSLLLIMINSINPASSQDRIGNIALRIGELQNKNTEFQNFNLFEKSESQVNHEVSETIRRYTLLKMNSIQLGIILSSRPEHIRLQVPSNHASGYVDLLLVKSDISQNGFTLETSDGEKFSELNPIVHYRGIISGDMNSVVSLSFSQEEIMGLICNDEGNYVLGKLDQPNSEDYVLYNDKDLVPVFSYECGTNTLSGVSPDNEQLLPVPEGTVSVNCVNWYYEIDYDIFVGKGSLANVNSYIQGIFNQVATLYDNDGISITLQTLFVWTTTDPYTGPSTSNYLSQFGAYRTSFAGDLANLVGYAGGGGVAYVNTLCASNTAIKMAYSGISASFQNVPTYSWTVEVITHEDGHLLGSRHTHDCVWNGNNTRIDNCGPQAGYSSGSCAAGPMPSNGTIMSYCHLVNGVGINFNNGFGPQPTALILNRVNSASCLSACNSCPTPPQPGNITGVTTYCQSTSQTYSITAVGGATSYSWTLPSGWSGTSSTNSISVSTGVNGGTISVIAINSCGNSIARTLTVTGNTAPNQTGNISGNTSVCQGTSQTYSVSAVAGATSYTWTLPSGWSGTSATNSINVTAGSSSGTLSVRANNSCGNSALRSMSVNVTSAPAQPLAISGQTTVCSNISYVYNIPAVFGATSYTWTLPLGWNGSSTSNSINVVSGIQGGTISVSATNGCGTSAVRTLLTEITLAPNQPQSISAIGGHEKVCPGDTKTYFIPSMANASSYTWTPPPGAVIMSGQGTTSATVSYNSGFIAHDSLKVVANNVCAVSEVRFKRIFRNTPFMPSVISGPNAGVCNNSGVNYSVVNVQGINFMWSFSQTGAIVTSGQGTSSITANFGATTSEGVLSVTANNGCGTTNARTLKIRTSPIQPGPITGTSTPCANQQGVPYSITPIPGTIYYTWKGPWGSRISDGTTISTTATLITTATQVTVNFKNNQGDVRVSATNLCGTGINRKLPVTFSCRISDTETPGTFNADVFPNPASDILNVMFYSNEISDNLIVLYDLSGKALFLKEGTSSAGDNEIIIELAGIAPGIYFLEIINGDQKHNSKVAVR